jgi:hypothetical protein
MRILGVVQWAARDKIGDPIAGVVPIVEIQHHEWRPINAVEEFPSQGQVFWHNSHAANQGSLICFRPEANPGQRDEFRVIDAKPAMEVIDLRLLGGPVEVRAALVAGVHSTGPVGTLRALVWCQPDVLVGPVEMVRSPTGMLKLTGSNLARVSTFTHGRPHGFSINGVERLVCIDESAPSGFVDWDDDETVLRRGLETAVRLARQTGDDTGQTKKQIEAAARALAAQGVGAETLLDKYRLERALALCVDTEAVAGLAPELVGLLYEHPAIRSGIEELNVTMRAQIERSIRAEIEGQLEGEKLALQEMVDARACASCELEATLRQLEAVKKELEAIEGRRGGALAEAEAAVRQVTHRREELNELRGRTESAALDAEAAENRAKQIKAELSALSDERSKAADRKHDLSDVSGAERDRAFLVHSAGGRGEALRDKVSLQRALTNTARASGIDPAVMLPLHAAVIARLMPAALGPSALSLMAAYAKAVCGGRIAVIHVSPNVIQLRDIDVASGKGIFAIAEGNREVDGLSILLLEGANRSPLEASVIPMLQLDEIAPMRISTTPGIRVAATFIVGATTVPVSPQLWSHAVAVYPDPAIPFLGESASGDVGLSSELLTFGDVPTGEIEEILNTWPDCQDLKPALTRYGSALCRFFPAERVMEELIQGLVLPYVVTALSPDDQVRALDGAGALNVRAVAAIRRLRRTIC